VNFLLDFLQVLNYDKIILKFVVLSNGLDRYHFARRKGILLESKRECGKGLLDVCGIFSSSFFFDDILTSSRLGSCQITFDLSLTIQSYARQLTILTNGTTARVVCLKI
jgi:hypothetical protein